MGEDISKLAGHDPGTAPSQRTNSSLSFLMATSSVAEKVVPPFQVALGSAQCAVGLPWLAGETVEAIFPQAQPAGSSGEFTLYRSGDWWLGSARANPGENPEVAAFSIYQSLLGATRHLSLARVWNYVPAINALGPAGLENYRAFCRGRSLAFEESYGAGFKQRLSSASAVGTDGDALVVIFAAGPQAMQHFENPQQVAAYDYPPEHGPRSPSFARATVVQGEHGRDIFVSGTAAIRGHQSVSGGIETQLQCTLENLQAIGQACGAGRDLGAGSGAERHVKVYLRREADLPYVATTLKKSFLRPTDRVSYLRSDVCRAELDVEIEATILGLK
jgi:enamine deaminase RidA (YjgF/YER057c/UK114 family)